MSKGRKGFFWLLSVSILFMFWVTGCQTTPHPPISLKQELIYQMPKKTVEVTKISIYSKNWEGNLTKWLDVGLKNNDEVARNFRVTVAVDDEPVVKAFTEKPVPPKQEGVVTISTTSKTFPMRLSIGVEIEE